MNFSEPFMSLYQSAMSYGLAYNSTVLQGAQRLRQLQLSQIEETQSALEKQAVLIQKPVASADMVNISTELMTGQFDRAIGYWSGLFNAAQQTQSDLAALTQGRVMEMTDGFKQQLEQTPNVMPAPMNSTLKWVSDVMHNSLHSDSPDAPAEEDVRQTESQADRQQSVSRRRRDAQV